MALTEFTVDQALLGAIDIDLLTFTEEVREGVNRARLIQGDASFQKDPQLNQTFRYLGGIGFSADGLSEDIVKKAQEAGGGIWTSDKGKDFVTFPSIEVVVLASARIRRYYAELEDGQERLICGTNQDGQHAKGWSGVLCNTCKFFPKNFEGKKQDACGASIPVLIYVPSLDHTAVLELRGASYMETTHWLWQISKLSKEFAKRPEIQKAFPGLERVNSYMFRTTLKAGEFRTGNDNNSYQCLEFTKASSPYDWAAVLNSADVTKRAKEILAQMEESWKLMYVGHNPNAVKSLPSPESPVSWQLPGETTAPVARKAVAQIATVDTPTPPAVSVVESNTEEYQYELF